MFLIALALLALAVLAELGSLALVPDAPASAGLATLVGGDEGMAEALGELSDEERRALLEQPRPPGLAIAYLALLDGLLLFSVGLMGASLLVPERVHGRLQGALTLVFALLILLGGIVLVVAAIAVLILMLSLLLATPFGTIAYLALYGFFDRTGAAAVLGVVMALKLGFAVCLVLAHQRFLQNRGLVLLIVTSLIGNVVIGFLHGFVPGFLVSITDALAAIVVAVLALLWALWFLVGSIGGVVRALSSARA
jgi:hypothetical protein